MIKNINLEFYQFILLIIMIFFTVYVWVKSMIKCSNNNTHNCEKIYNENKKLKKYILYFQKYLNQSNKSNKNHDNENIMYY
jgi:ABC-type maltose transport system permease subunit